MCFVTKSYRIVFITLLFTSLFSCSTSKSKNFSEITLDHKRIAVLPFESKLTLTKNQRKKIGEQKLVELERAQGIDVQDAVESYLVGKKLSVQVQSSGSTNSTLKNNGIDIYNLNATDPKRLCSILGVDAVMVGYIETVKPMDEELAQTLEIAKALERDLLGTSYGSVVNTSTNSGNCRLSLLESKHGDRIWSYNKKLQMGIGSTIQDIINSLMRKGARKFPYKK